MFYWPVFLSGALFGVGIATAYLVIFHSNIVYDADKSVAQQKARLRKALDAYVADEKEARVPNAAPPNNPAEKN